MSYLLIRQKFVDYDRWRAAYDEMTDVRARAGLRTVLLTRNVEDPDEIVVVFEVDDVARAREYMAGDGLRAAWERGGVIPETNEVTLLEAAAPRGTHPGSV